MQVVATHRARQPGAPLWALILFSVSSTMFAWSACGKGRVRQNNGEKNKKKVYDGKKILEETRHGSF